MAKGQLMENPSESFVFTLVSWLLFSKLYYTGGRSRSQLRKYSHCGFGGANWLATQALMKRKEEIWRK